MTEEQKKYIEDFNERNKGREPLDIFDELDDEESNMLLKCVSSFLRDVLDHLQKQ